MEQLTDTKRTLEGLWEGYQMMTLEAARAAYETKHRYPPQFYVQVPGLLLLGPIEEPRKAEAQA